MRMGFGVMVEYLDCIQFKQLKSEAARSSQRNTLMTVCIQTYVRPFTSVCLSHCRTRQSNSLDFVHRVFFFVFIFLISFGCCLRNIDYQRTIKSVVEIQTTENGGSMQTKAFEFSAITAWTKNGSLSRLCENQKLHPIEIDESFSDSECIVRFGKMIAQLWVSLQRVILGLGSWPPQYFAINAAE